MGDEIAELIRVGQSGTASDRIRSANGDRWLSTATSTLRPSCCSSTNISSVTSNAPEYPYVLQVSSLGQVKDPSAGFP